MRYFISVIILTTILMNGCTQPPKVAPYRAVAAVSVAGALVGDGLDNGPTVKYKRSKCPVCHGTGKVRSGDGIALVDCQYCEPDNNAEQLPKEVKKPVQNWKTKTGRCSPECKCEDGCTCMWAWECLGLDKAASDARWKTLKDRTFWGIKTPTAVQPKKVASQGRRPTKWTDSWIMQPQQSSCANGHCNR